MPEALPSKTLSGRLFDGLRDVTLTLARKIGSPEPKHGMDCIIHRDLPPDLQGRLNLAIVHDARSQTFEVMGGVTHSNAVLHIFGASTKAIQVISDLIPQLAAQGKLTRVELLAILQSTSYSNGTNESPTPSS